MHVLFLFTIVVNSSNVAFADLLNPLFFFFLENAEAKIYIMDWQSLSLIIYLQEIHEGLKHDSHWFRGISS